MAEETKEMLRIVVGEEMFDETDNTFSVKADAVIDLEHSLVSLSKWESKHQKPFLGKDVKTTEETMSYVMAMVVTPDTDLEILSRFSQENMREVNAYIESPHSATTFGEMPKVPGRGETITSELIYYWMVAFQIPFEAEKWHLNNLFALIRICNIKNAKPKKMGRAEIAQRNAEINRQRRESMGTKG
jgi:hypothetical protein